MPSDFDQRTLRSILWNPDLDVKDRLLLTLIHTEQETGKFAKHADLAEAIESTPPTVARRLRHLRERGLISIHKAGRYEWRYDLSPLVREFQTLHSDPSSESDLTSDDESRSGENTCQTLRSHPSPHPTSTPYTPEYNEKVIELFPKKTRPEHTVGEATDASPPAQAVRGPNTPLKADVEALIKTKVRKASKGATFSVRKDTRREKHTAKSDAEYNVHDLELLFQDEWKKSKLVGRAFRWTGKDRGQAKHLMSDQGSESSAKLIRYVFANWTDLMKRYSVTGVPSMSVIYAYRRSWLGEALQGGPVTRRGPSEWVEDGNDEDEVSFMEL